MSHEIINGTIELPTFELSAAVERLTLELSTAAVAALTAAQNPTRAKDIEPVPFADLALDAIEATPQLRERLKRRGSINYGKRVKVPKLPNYGRAFEPRDSSSEDTIDTSTRARGAKLPKSEWIEQIQRELRQDRVSQRKLPTGKFTWPPAAERPMPTGADSTAPSDRMEIRIRAVEWLDETDPEGSHDDMQLAGTIIGPNGEMAQIGMIDLGGFDDPNETALDQHPALRSYDPPMLFGATMMSQGVSWPRIYTVVFTLANHDNGGLDGFVETLFDKSRDKIKAAIESAIAESSKRSGAETGAAASLAGSAWGLAGTVIGAAIGAMFGAVFAAVMEWWGDDVFMPSTQVIGLERPEYRFTNGQLQSAVQRVILRDAADADDAEGVYALEYDVVVTPDEDVVGRFATPAATAAGTGRIELVARGADHRMYRKTYGDGWRPSQVGFASIGGLVTGRAAIVAHAGRFELFARGHDDAVWHKQVVGPPETTATLGWTSFELPVSSAPAAVALADTLHLFVRAADGSYLWRARRAESWAPWRPLGGDWISMPVAITSGPDRIDVFGRGLDNGVYVRSFHHGEWNEWTPLGGQIRGIPAATSRGPGRRDLVARGLDDAVYHRSQVGDGGWTDWTRLGGVIVGSPTIVAWGSERLDVFVRGQSGQVHHRAWDPTLGWAPSDWQALGGQIVGSPMAVSWGVGRLDVFARAADGTIVHRGWERGWLPIGGWDSLGTID